MKPLQAAVLAFAVQRRFYGYEITKLIEQSACAALLKPNKPAIYNALRRLESLGYITTDVEDAGQHHQTTKRRWSDYRRWYRPTEQGLRAYAQWVTGDIASEAEPPGVLLRIALAAPLGTGALQTILHRCEELCATREQTLEAMQNRDADKTAIEALCDRLVIAERRTALQSVRAWLRVAREEIDTFDQQHNADARAGSPNGRSGEAARRDKRRSGTPS